MATLIDETYFILIVYERWPKDNVAFLGHRSFVNNVNIEGIVNKSGFCLKADIVKNESVP